MEEKFFYGLLYKTNQIEQGDFKKIARLLFLSQSNSAKDVHRLIKHIKEDNREKFEEYSKKLVYEISLIKKQSENLTEAQLDIANNLQEWIDNFECNPDEVNEYVTFYNLPFEIISNIRLIAKDKIDSPKNIFRELDKYVVGQESAKKILSAAVYTHLLRHMQVKPQITLNFKGDYDEVPLLPNPNIILIGSTGTGKSYILKTIAKLFGLPFLKIDCASLTSSGYVGNGLNEYLNAFYIKCRKNKSDISQAIIFFDEFDKLSEQAYSRDQGSVGGVEMQQEFLNLLEDKEYLLNNRKAHEESTLINLSNCMFVFGGSFYGIDSIIQKRIGQGQSLGFRSPNKQEVSKDMLIQKVMQEDLLNFGILPELVGRVNHIVTLQDHSKETIIEIIKGASDSILTSYQNYFDLHMDKLIIEEEVFDLIAEKVLKTGTGARALNGIFNELLKDLIYESPNMEMETFVVDKEYFEEVFGAPEI